MEEKHAQELVDGLKHHSGMVVNFGEDKVVESLVKTAMFPSSKFYEKVDFKSELIQEPNNSDRYHYLHITKVLRNDKARCYELSPRKNAAMNLAKEFGMNSTTHLSRKLRLEPALVSEMTIAAEDGDFFSLLGRLDTYDNVEREGALYKKRRPLLVILGIKNKDLIRNWEDAETVYEKEIRRFFIFGGKSKKITREQYISSV